MRSTFLALTSKYACNTEKVLENILYAQTGCPMRVQMIIRIFHAFHPHVLLDLRIEEYNTTLTVSFLIFRSKKYYLLLMPIHLLVHY